MANVIDQERNRESDAKIARSEREHRAKLIMKHAGDLREAYFHLRGLGCDRGMAMLYDLICELELRATLIEGGRT